MGAGVETSVLNGGVEGMKVGVVVMVMLKAWKSGVDGTLGVLEDSVSTRWTRATR